MTDTILTHLWQEQGLGTAPFDAVCVIALPSPTLAEHNPSGYTNAMVAAGEEARAFGVALGVCNSCGMGLVNNVVIRDAHRKHFVVGCDCARKTNDARLMSRVEYLEKKRKRAVRAAQREQQWQERAAKIAAEEAAQRERNGGLTDAELQAQRRAEEERTQEAACKAANRWLLEVLHRANSSDFVESTIYHLSRKPLADLSHRCHDVLAEIYAKHAGRRGSKAYLAAFDEFWAKAAS